MSLDVLPAVYNAFRSYKCQERLDQPYFAAGLSFLLITVWTSDVFGNQISVLETGNNLDAKKLFYEKQFCIYTYF